MTTSSPARLRCWWCGVDADSREHRYKRTDLVNLFGAGAWRGTVNRVVEGAVRVPQSASSRELKFAASLCAQCNNDRSQPLDRAYEAFIGYYDGHEGDVALARTIDLRRVYGAAWASGRENLARYMVKHVGCRLAEAGMAVPTSFTAYLDGGPAWPDSLTVTALFRLDLWEVSRHTSSVHQVDTRGVFIGPMPGKVDELTDHAIEAQSHYLYKSLGIHWRMDITAPSGGRNFEGPIISLPEFAVAAPSEILAECAYCRPEGGGA